MNRLNNEETSRYEGSNYLSEQLINMIIENYVNIRSCVNFTYGGSEWNLE